MRLICTQDLQEELLCKQRALYPNAKFSGCLGIWWQDTFCSGSRLLKHLEQNDTEEGYWYLNGNWRIYNERHPF